MEKDIESIEYRIVIGDIPNLETLLDQERYGDVKEEIECFLKDLLSNEIGITDSIIGLDRKGIWILNDFFCSNPKLAKFNLLSNNQIKSELISNMNILIFDDSVHKGDSILKEIDSISHYKPKRIVVSCLLINDTAYKRIKRLYPDIEIHFCKPIFKDYTSQQITYSIWEIAYLSGIRRSDNPDYPIIILIINDTKMDAIADLITTYFKSKWDDGDIYEVDSKANHRDCRCYSILGTATQVLNGNSYEFDSEPDLIKIRCWLTRIGDKIELRLLPLINTRFEINSECQIRAKTPKKCLLNMINQEEINEKICAFCYTARTNSNFIKSIRDEISIYLLEKGIIIEKEDFEFPHFGRFNW